jgi:hypothetical protein
MCAGRGGDQARKTDTVEAIAGPMIGGRIGLQKSEDAAEPRGAVE